MISKLDHLIVAVKDLDEAERNYKKIFGVDPVWRGEHKELGTANVIFNFKNTYFELLASNGAGLGSDFVNTTIEESGEGLIGSVLGSENIKSTFDSIKNKGHLLGDISDGEGTNLKNNETRKWKNLFLPLELTRGIFTFIIEHTEGNLPFGRFSMSLAHNSSGSPSAAPGSRPTSTTRTANRGPTSSSAAYGLDTERPATGGAAAGTALPGARALRGRRPNLADVLRPASFFASLSWSPSNTITDEACGTSSSAGPGRRAVRLFASNARTRPHLWQLSGDAAQQSNNRWTPPP